MAHKAPGKYYRKGVTLLELTRMFPDDATAERWFVKTLWPKGPVCPHCGSLNIQERPTRKPQPYRCRDCRRDFSVKTGSLMHGSKLGCRTWAFAIYLLTTGIKGVSSMKLHRDLGVTQKTAWFLAHRIRENFETISVPFRGPVEVDETYFGGRRKNMSNAKRQEIRKTVGGRGAVGKTAVAGAKDRHTNQVRAEVVTATDRATLHPFVGASAAPGAKVFTDDARAYHGMPFDHETVKHSVSQYVNGMAHTNGIESFWALLKRGYHGTYHHVSEKHLGRYVDEFSGRFNSRDRDTLDQMALIARGLSGKRLRYCDLISG
ncbi:MAG: IS1595 family transposase [Rhodospirillales bacterium]|nr:IS1595 family transposase [Rhodospirillales bacterium]